MAIILLKSGVVDAFVAFVLTGAVPGTLYSLSPRVMLITFGLIGYSLLLRSSLPSLSKR